MNWIRMATTMKGDATVHRLAAVLTKGDVPKMIGHLQCVLAELPAHARNGDISGVPASLLEHWALWTGRRGQFDTEFRAAMCTDAGVIRAWDVHNGSAIREADRNAANARQYRQRKRDGNGDAAGAVQ